jgi:hypothetical protein
MIPDTDEREVLFEWERWPDKADYYGFYTHLSNLIAPITPPDRSINPCAWVKQVVGFK